jgi:hypothetical protein
VHISGCAFVRSAMRTSLSLSSPSIHPDVQSSPNSLPRTSK